MPDVYDPGDQIELVHTFQGLDGLAADPTTVTLNLFHPDGTLDGYVYPAGLTREDVGRYRRYISITDADTGLWLYEWIGTGAVEEHSSGFFYVSGLRLLDLVREVRAAMHDYPRQVYVADSPTLLAAANFFTVGSVAESAQFQAPSGTIVEFDDPTGEVAITSGPADQNALTVPIRRGQHGTPAQNHAEGTAVLVSPRFRWPQIQTVLFEIVELELWPHVWILGEFDMLVNATTDIYPVPVPGVTELVYAYQHVPNVGKVGIRVDFMAPEFAAGDEFRDGAITVGAVPRYDNIHVAYKAKPQLGNLDGRTRALAIMGAKAQLMIDEEMTHVAPSASAVEGRVGDGAKLRAGALQWQRFETARAKQLAVLLEAESAFRRQLARQVS